MDGVQIGFDTCLREASLRGRRDRRKEIAIE